MRTKRGSVRRRRANRVLRAARGYWGARSRLFKPAKETLRRALWYAKDHRRDKKGDFRRLWIARINAATRARGISYSRFMQGLKKAQVELDRKVLANLALTDDQAFDRLVAVAQQAL